MIEKPMLFSAPMVRALLDSSKVQTRRIINPQPEVDGSVGPAGLLYLDRIPHPVGSRIWVKETFARVHECFLLHLDPEPDNGLSFNNGFSTVYRADGEPSYWENYGTKWKPSIFMRKEYSRITLEVTAVRVERLQDISEDDCRSEGVKHDGFVGYYCDELDGEYGSHRCNWRAGYKRLWESIHGAGSWEKNPWVWVYGLKRLTASSPACPR